MLTNKQRLVSLLDVIRDDPRRPIDKRVQVELPLASSADLALTPSSHATRAGASVMTINASNIRVRLLFVA